MEEGGARNCGIILTDTAQLVFVVVVVVLAGLVTTEKTFDSGVNKLQHR